MNNDNKWELVSDKIGLKDTNGIWQSIESDDFNNDGIPDFVVGNMGQNGFYKPNMKFYLNDFDKNGKLETIYTYKINGDDYPIHDRDELIKTITRIKRSFFITRIIQFKQSMMFLIKIYYYHHTLDI